MFEVTTQHGTRERVVRLRCDTCLVYVPNGLGGCDFATETDAFAALERFLGDCWLWDATGRAQCEDCRDALHLAAYESYRREEFPC